MCPDINNPTVTRYITIFAACATLFQYVLIDENKENSEFVNIIVR
jgi:hypothetical protein